MRATPIVLDTLIAIESLAGWNLTGGAGAAQVNLRGPADDGDLDNAGVLLASVAVAANSTDTVVFERERLHSVGGVYVEDVSGTMAGVLYHS